MSAIKIRNLIINTIAKQNIKRIQTQSFSKIRSVRNHPEVSIIHEDSIYELKPDKFYSTGYYKMFNDKGIIKANYNLYYQVEKDGNIKFVSEYVHFYITN